MYIEAVALFNEAFTSVSPPMKKWVKFSKLSGFE